MEKLFAKDYPKEIIDAYIKNKFYFTSYSNKNIYEFS
jgi:hypothetical protein